MKISKNIIHNYLVPAALCIGLGTTDAQASKRFLIDRIVARVNGTNILYSDLSKPRIEKDGRPYDLDEAVGVELLYQRACNMHMEVGQTDVERAVVSFKMHNHLEALSDDEFEEQLKQMGFTLARYKDEIKRHLTIERLKQTEVSDKMILNEQLDSKIIEYYNNNPQYSTAMAKVRIAALSETQKDKDINTLVKHGEVAWDELGWLRLDSIDEQYAVIKRLNPGDMSKPIKVDDQYHVIQLLESKPRELKSLESRRKKIEEHLIHQQREELIKKLEEEVKSKATIVYL